LPVEALQSVTRHSYRQISCSRELPQSVASVVACSTGTFIYTRNYYYLQSGHVREKWLIVCSFRKFKESRGLQWRNNSIAALHTSRRLFSWDVASPTLACLSRRRPLALPVNFQSGLPDRGHADPAPRVPRARAGGPRGDGRALARGDCRPGRAAPRGRRRPAAALVGARPRRPARPARLRGCASPSLAPQHVRRALQPSSH
ncbi:Protein of unknown function, partial [Gryllus bimaculatus]